MKRFWKNSVSVLLGISIILASACAPATTPQSTITQTPSTAATGAPVITPGGPPIFTPSTAVTPAPVITPSTAVRPPPVITGGGQDVHYGGQGGVPPATPTTPAETGAPLVSLTIPLNLDTGVGINSAISVAFTEAMNPLTINVDTFTLKRGATPVAGTVTYAGVTATFTPSSSLAPNTTYTANITTGIKDVAGNALAVNRLWTFTTAVTPDTTAPIVTGTVNPNGATGVSVNTKISAFFSEALNPLTVTTDTFTMMRGTTPVAGNVSYIGLAATFAPNAVLAPNTEYTLTITTGVKDLAGNALASPYIWKWTTGANPDNTAPTVTSTIPRSAATGVAVNYPFISANFSEGMDPLTLTAATFTVKQGSTLIPGMVTVTFGSTANFLLADILAYSTVYTVTITTGAKDLAGNALAVDKVWTFTTVAIPTSPPAGGGPILASNPTAPNLGEAGRFVILASQAVTTTPGSLIANGDIGVIDQARTFITGFTPFGPAGDKVELTNGTTYAPDDANPAPFPYPFHFATPVVGAQWTTTGAMMTQVRTDMGIAYTFLKADPNPTAPTQVCPIQLGGRTLTRGVYKTAVDVSLTTGPLHLDAQGDPNSVFIFVIGGTFTVGAPSGSIILDNLAQAKNVYFVSDGLTTIEAGRIVRGNIFATSQVNVAAGANIIGRLWAQTDRVTLISNSVTKGP